MNKLLLKNVTLIDGTVNCKAKNNTDILVVDDKITKIGNDLKTDKDTKVIELDGKYVIPGLINLHVHLPGNGKAPWKNSNNQKLVKILTSTKLFDSIGMSLGKKYAIEGLKAGVTSLRAVGGVSYFDTMLRDKINSGKIVGPTIFAANDAIATKNGHMVGTVAVAVDTIEEAVERVHFLNNQGVDLIKIMITGGVLDAKKRGEPGILKMEGKFVKAICDEAHKLGLQVAAHVESFAGQQVALENGVDTIEHGSLIDDKQVSLFKKNNSAYVATLSPAIPLAVFDEQLSGCNSDVQYNSYVLLDNFYKGIKKALENNIPVGLGTDTGCPFVTHYNFYRELVFFQNMFKLPNNKVLNFATLGNAQIIKKDGLIGSLEPNKQADIVVLNKNPLDDLNNLANPFMVIKSGKVLKNIMIKKNPYIDECLDKIQNIDIIKFCKDKFKNEK